MAQAPRNTSNQNPLFASYQTALDRSRKTSDRRLAQSEIEMHIFRCLKQAPPDVRNRGNGILWNFAVGLPRKLENLAQLEDHPNFFSSDLHALFKQNAVQMKRVRESRHKWLENQLALLKIKINAEAAEEGASTANTWCCESVLSCLPSTSMLWHMFGS